MSRTDAIKETSKELVYASKNNQFSSANHKFKNISLVYALNKRNHHILARKVFLQPI
jgi:hypothetical protein